MCRTDVAIVGAGQAGLAMSRCLVSRGIDHVLLERGRIGERWRSRPWEALRLLTPNWMTRLPGHTYHGPDPDGFMDRASVVRLLDDYARAGGAPIVGNAPVHRLAAAADGFLLATECGDWRARAVVVATGACERAVLPAWAGALRRAEVVHAGDYRRPADLPPGGALVVGASASGVQLARELRAAGREVTLAVGRHVRVPRRYRGRDLMAWMDAAGMLDEPWHAMPDIATARAAPSLQLTGSGGDLGLPELQAEGVRLVGRVADASAGRVSLAPTLAVEVAASERRRRRLLSRIDTHVAATGQAAPPDPSAWTPPAISSSGLRTLDLRAMGISTVVLATGYRPDHGWIDLPALGPDGEIMHAGGIGAVPGLYVLGLRFLRRRSSSFIDGIGRDAEALAAHLAGFLGASRIAA